MPMRASTRRHRRARCLPRWAAARTPPRSDKIALNASISVLANHLFTLIFGGLLTVSLGRFLSAPLLESLPRQGDKNNENAADRRGCVWPCWRRRPLPKRRYDRKLEQAVIDIVANKIGDIRGGFSYDAKPVFVIVQDQIVDGLDPARNASALSRRRTPGAGRRCAPRSRAQDRHRMSDHLLRCLPLPARAFAKEGR